MSGKSGCCSCNQEGIEWFEDDQESEGSKDWAHGTSLSKALFLGKEVHGASGCEEMAVSGVSAEEITERQWGGQGSGGEEDISDSNSGCFIEHVDNVQHEEGSCGSGGLEVALHMQAS